MNKLNFLNREIETTTKLNFLLAAGTAVAMLSPISMFASWSRVNQVAFKAVLLGNLLQTQQPNNLLFKLIKSVNPITMPYFIGLSLISAYTDPTYGLQVQLPKLIDTLGAIPEKLPSQAQVMETLGSLRDKIPSQAQVMETLGTLRGKIPTQEQMMETVGIIREKVSSKVNMTALTELYQQHAESKSLILIPVVAAVATLSIVGYSTYRCCRTKQAQ